MAIRPVYERRGKIFHVTLEQAEDGWIVAECPVVPGCVSQGDSLEDALRNAREAISLCLEVRRQDQLLPVVETPEVVAREVEECLHERAELGLPLTIETREVEVEDRVTV